MRTGNVKLGESRIPLTATLLPCIVEELEGVAKTEDRTRSAVVERLLLRGIAAYKRDGQLVEKPAAAPTESGMDNLQIFTYQEQDVRSVLIDGAPFFVAADVCRILDIGNPTMALARLDDDERTLISIEGASNRLPVNAVSEAGLYSLILSSRKPEAKGFKRWITHKVIPAIRQTGKYELPIPKDADEQALILAAEVTRLVGEKRQLQSSLAISAPKAEAFDSLMNASGLYTMQAASQMLGMGRRRLFDLCRALHILQPLPKRLPYQRFVDAGYFEVKAIEIRGLEKAEYQSFVTPRGLDWLRKQLQA